MALSTPALKRYSVDDLASFPDDGRLRELVDGRLVEWDVPNCRHGFVLFALGAALRAHVRLHRLGQVVGGESMVRIGGSRFHARGADIAFYRRGRRPSNVDEATTALAPDFVGEILSPTDRADEVLEKVHDWLRAGVRLLWYVDPITGTTTVWQSNTTRYVDAEAALEAGDVIPGFQVRLRDLLDELSEDEM